MGAKTRPDPKFLKTFYKVCDEIIEAIFKDGDNYECPPFSAFLAGHDEAKKKIYTDGYQYAQLHPMKDYKLPYELMIKGNEFYYCTKTDETGIYAKPRLIGAPCHSVVGMGGYWSYCALQFLER